MNWKLKKFEELEIKEFHDILQLRINVFVVEQNCPYPELDNRDFKAFHFYGQTEEDDRIVAYTRIFGPGDYFEEAAIGRVVVDKQFRKNGTGIELMSKSIEQIKNLFGPVGIKIGAQTYLREFYESLGFEKVGEDYLEDGIPHIYMELKKGL